MEEFALHRVYVCCIIFLLVSEGRKNTLRSDSCASWHQIGQQGAGARNVRRALVASIAKIACSTLLIRKIELRIKTEVEWTRWYSYSYRPHHLLINQVRRVGPLLKTSIKQDGQMRVNGFDQPSLL